MNRILTTITQKKQLLNKYLPLPTELVANLEDWLKVEVTYSSNAIEGNALSRIQTAEIINKGTSAVISGKSLQDQFEAINHAKAVDFIRKLAFAKKSHQYITEQDILDIHKIILTNINDQWAGKYRQIDIFVRGSDAEFPQPKDVPHKIEGFIEWLQSIQGEHPVHIAAQAQYRFVTIHPFVDGNGRTARLLMNLILLIHQYPMTIIRVEDRAAYLDTFEIARKNLRMKPFYELVYIAVERSLDIYLEAVGKRKEKQTMLKKPTIKIGELAKLTGQTVHTLRFWTKEGLLTVIDYSAGGYQLYNKEAVKIVNKIRKLQDTKRLTIVEIKKLLNNP